MIETVQSDILKVLGRVLHILHRGAYGELKELSNHTIHNASIFQDEDSVSMAVIIYALSKILTRPKLVHAKGAIEESVRHIEHALSGNQLAVYKQSLHQLFHTITEIDGKLELYIDEILTYAEIKKASYIYAHGISMARTAQLLGVSEWALAQSVGKTRQDEYETVPLVQRHEFVRGLFGVSRQ